MITVGYWDQTYAEKRLIVNKENKGKVKFVPIEREKDDWVLSGLKSMEAFHVDWFTNRKKFYYHPHKENKYNLIHCFNGVCNAKTPWLSSYETMLPRILNVDLEKPINRIWMRYNAEQMAKDNCKGLFPISQSAYEIQAEYIKRYLSEYYDDIMKKTRVIHPPQREIVTEEEIIEKNRSIKEEIKFIFVGTGFYFKGGKETVEALARYKNDYKIHLTIVSDFFIHPSQEPGYAKEDYRECMNFLKANRDWITIHNKLSNRQVLKLCAKSHVGLLASYGDTYGYACLEHQACGCPVITSDIRAFPEINNNDCGYIYHLDKTLSGKEQQEMTRENVARMIGQILENPCEIEQKGLASLRRIREYHSPKRYADEIFKEYNKALSH